MNFTVTRVKTVYGSIDIVKPPISLTLANTATGLGEYLEDLERRLQALEAKAEEPPKRAKRKRIGRPRPNEAD